MSPEKDYSGVDKTYVLRVPYYGEVFINLDDTIHRHGRPKYDHMRVIEYDDGISISLLFLGSVALDQIAELGFAEAYLDEPTSLIVREFDRDLLAKLEKDMQEE